MRAGAVAGAAALLAWVGLATACSPTIHPLQRPNARARPPHTFSHADLDRVLARHVDAEGLVDYARLAREPFVLGTYLGQLAAYSPGSHPALFPDEAARLAYWLNAYNALVLRFVLEHYPIASVLEVRTGWWTRFGPDGTGFFAGQRFPLGGRSTSLRALEDRIIRRYFPDPRVHFALNCASLGCPKLPRHAFDAAQLEAQLAAETTRFLSEPRNLRVDEAARTVHLSRIFEWFAEDFTRWQRRRGRPATVLAFVAEHAPPRAAAAVARAAAAGFAVRFVPWDWRLNDRALGPRPDAPGPRPDAPGDGPDAP
jgi:hypothetical protein